MFPFLHFGFIGSFFMFLLNVLIAAGVAYRAWNMGRSFPIWFLYAYLLTVIAVIHVFLIAPDEDGILHQRKQARCPECSRPVDPDSARCPICKADLTEKYLYVPSAPSEKKVIFLIALTLITNISVKFVTPDIISGIVKNIGGDYGNFVHNLGVTLEVFGVPRDIAATIIDKMSAAP